MNKDALGSLRESCPHLALHPHSEAGAFEFFLQIDDYLFQYLLEATATILSHPT
ncbi:MAG TPA: hypothetical protein VMW88_01235 [Thermoplasmata archaeon]|jgi:hypothetical protein|nr:hypothetical protein [Thermoplasmata archaeon]